VEHNMCSRADLGMLCIHRQTPSAPAKAQSKSMGETKKSAEGDEKGKDENSILTVSTFLIYPPDSTLRLCAYLLSPFP
jgi:hypothetical protein